MSNFVKDAWASTIGEGNPVVFKSTTTGGVDVPSVIVDSMPSVSVTVGSITIADGGDTAQGTTTDAAVVTDANGTISGKLRGLVKLLASVISGGLLQIRALTSADQVTVANSTLAVTESGTWSVRAQDGSGNALTSTGSALDVNLKTLAYGALPVIKIGATVTVAIGASSAASAAITATVVRLVSTVDCFIVFGAATPTATTAGLFLPASTPEYFSFTSGQEVAVIQSSASGSLYVTAAA